MSPASAVFPGDRRRSSRHLGILSRKVARSFLKIGAGLNTWREPEALELDLLKQIVDVVPAEKAAIVLLPQSPGREPTITGWDRQSKLVAPIPVSRTLITTAIKDSTAIFSDDVTSRRLGYRRATGRQRKDDWGDLLGLDRTREPAEPRSPGIRSGGCGVRQYGPRSGAASPVSQAKESAFAERTAVGA